MKQKATIDTAISPEEQALRQDLAGCYRIFHQLGWVELIYNHITLRVPGEHDHFLINRFGLMYDEVTASNLLKIDLDGRPVGSAGRVNPAGFVIHSAIHANLPDAICVMHAHTTAGMAVASKRGGLAMTNFYSTMLYDQVAYHPFEGVTVNPDEGARLLANMAGRRQLILENHGLLTWGGSIAEAFVRMWTLNRACEVDLASRSMNGEDLPVTEEACRQASREALQFNPDFGAGRDVFDALMRRLDVTCPDYCR